MEALSPAKASNQRKIAVGPHNVCVEPFAELRMVRKRHIIVRVDQSFVFGEIDGVIARLDEKVVQDAPRKVALLLVERNASCKSPELRLFLTFFQVPERIRNRLFVKNEVVDVFIRDGGRRSVDDRDFNHIDLLQVHPLVHFLAECAFKRTVIQYSQGIANVTRNAGKREVEKVVGRELLHGGLLAKGSSIFRIWLPVERQIGNRKSEMQSRCRDEMEKAGGGQGHDKWPVLLS